MSVHRPSAVRWRELLGLPAALVGGMVVAGCESMPGTRAMSGAASPTASPTAGAPQEEAPVTPPEDLMREHGVLKRVPLIYREGIRRAPKVV